MRELRREFGSRVRDLREAKRLSQEELAARTGFHPNYIGGVERGRINLSLRNAVRLAEVLGASLSTLIESSEPPRLEPASRARQLREQVLERLKGQPTTKLALILDVVRVLTRKSLQGRR